MSEIVENSICQIVDEDHELFCALIQVNKIEDGVAHGIIPSLNSDGDDVVIFFEDVPFTSLAYVGMPEYVIDHVVFKEKTENLTFGQALEAVKDDKLIARAGWNGKGMFVFLRPEQSINMGMFVNIVKSAPQTLKSYYAQLIEIGTHKETEIHFSAYLCLKKPDDSIVNGWIASQEDMLADDWMIVNL